MILTHTIRLYPTPHQEAQMWQHIGASRWIWNWALAKQKERYETGEKHLSAFDLINCVTELKHEYPWLSAVSRDTLNRVMQDVADAYSRFFKQQCRYPKFKSKGRSAPRFPVRCDGVYFTDTLVHIPKLGKLRYRATQPIPFGKGHHFTNPRIKRIGSKWLLTVGVDRPQPDVTLSDRAMGIDLGIKTLVTATYGGTPICFPNINKSRRVRKLSARHRHLQRALSRKRKGSHNRAKAKARVAAVSRKLANIRRNYTHKMTTRLTRLLPNRITVEDLNVTGMMKNHHLARHIAEANFAEIRRQLAYKAEFLGIPLTEAPRFYPSSRLCSACGAHKADLKLSDRRYVCSHCGAAFDRDINAALNLERYAG
jgi:putative transposase